MIPPFDRRGNLPPGVHRASWDELDLAALDPSIVQIELEAGL